MVPPVLRRLRGIAGVALTWALVWAALGAGLGILFGLLRPQDVDPGETPALMARVLGTAGFISGAGFALLLSLLERGRTVGDVSLGRVALWGVTGGAIIPLLTPVAASQLVWTCPLGAVLATASLAVARRVERRQVEAGGRVHDVRADCRGGRGRVESVMPHRIVVRRANRSSATGAAGA